METIKYKYDGCETVEIKIKSTSQQKYYLPDIPQIKGKIIKRIDIPFDILRTPNNRDDYDYDNVKVSYLTIVEKNNILVHRLPFYYLLQDSTITNPKAIFDFILTDTEKSYIEIAATDDLATDESIFLTFYYINPEREIKKRRSDFFYKSFRKNEKIKIYPLPIKVLDTTQTKIFLPDDEFLKTKRLVKIKLYANAEVLIGSSITEKTPDSLDMVSFLIYRKAYIELKKQNGERLKNLPLVQVMDNYEPEYFWNDLKIDWPNSFITIPNTDSLVQDEVFYLLIYYKDEIKHRALRRLRNI